MVVVMSQNTSREHFTFQNVPLSRVVYLMWLFERKNFSKRVAIFGGVPLV